MCASAPRTPGVSGAAMCSIRNRTSSSARAAQGEDPDFHKGSTAFERAAGDPDNQPNPCVAPLGPGPYYAIRIEPGDIGTMLGVKVDAASRALDADGQPIPGLYAVGTVATSIMAGTYPCAGAMLGPALTFGYLAALDIAGPRNKLGMSQFQFKRR